jgi:hypothetical protein
VEFSDSIGVLSFRINEDVEPPVETVIEFADNPRIAKYTGLAISDTLAQPPEPLVYFIRPVKIGSHVSIVQTGITEEIRYLEPKPELKIRGNPTNQSFLVEFFVPTSSHVRLAVFDVLGQEVALLVDRYYNSGRYQISWNANSVTSGVYFCRLATENGSCASKMTLLK